MLTGEPRDGGHDRPAEIRHSGRVGLKVRFEVREQQPVAVRVVVDEGPIGHGEGAEVGRRVAGRHLPVQDRVQVRGHRIPHRPDERRAVGDVLVQRWPADTDALGDGGHDDAVEALLLEEAAGGIDDGVAGRSGWSWHDASIGY